MIIFCDLDHCVSDAAWRDNMIGGEGGWPAYHAAGKDDKPVMPMVRLCRALASPNQHVSLVGLTMRPEAVRQQTMKWLLKHGVMFDALLMRPDNDYRKSPEAKLALALEYLEHNTEKEAIIVDDREDVLSKFSDIGFTTLQVRVGRRKEGDT